MLKLLLFAPCEKIVEDKSTNNISLISIMQEVTFEVPKEMIPLPAKAMVPQAWSVFSMWQREADERPEFETKVSMVSPDGELILETEVAKIDFLNHKVLSQRVVMHISGFPVGYTGQCHVVLKTKQKGDTEYSEAARFPITINQKAIPVAEASKRA